ncbi:MAG: hypothetical protein LCH61_03065 [Proteobacteria bacterium]|nr:hypothetical protein [Pseudomonadota bacterium]
MDTDTLILFSLTVLPLICTPGPDFMFVMSQSSLAMSVQKVDWAIGCTGGLTWEGAVSFSPPPV